MKTPRGRTGRPHRRARGREDRRRYIRRVLSASNSKQVLSVIICSHNPRSDYLGRVLAALDQQTFPKQLWELLLVDNASREPLASPPSVQLPCNGRHVREDELGLTPARLRGIRESSGDLLVFLDDDNVPATDYLRTAFHVAADHPYVGAFGGSIRGEFEIPPEDWIKPYLPSLPVCEIDEDYWSNLKGWSKAVPYGAGLCVRRQVAEHYLRRVATDPRRRTLGRRGSAMGACEDTDLAWCAVDVGLGTGRFCSLKLTHLIPRQRMTQEYIVRLQAGLDGSWTALGILRSDRAAERGAHWAGHLRFSWHLLRASPIERRILIASRRARLKVSASLRSEARVIADA
jgi:Glycosyl transferase family 2